jgi:hypothetical protein
VASVFFVVVLLIVWFLQLREAGFGGFQATGLVGVIALHPTVVWTATSGDMTRSLSLFFFYLLCLSVVRFTERGDARSVFNMGIVLVLFFFTNPGIIYFTVTFSMLFVVLLIRRISPVNAAGALVALVSPLFLAIGSWGYLNWLYTGDVLGFMNRAGSQFAGGWSLAPYYPWLRAMGGHLTPAMLPAVSLSVAAFPLLIYCNVSAFLSRDRNFLLVLVLTGLPPVLLMVSTMNFYSRYPVSDLYLVPATLMVCLVYVGRGEGLKRTHILVPALAVAGLVGGLWLQQSYATGRLEHWNHAVLAERRTGGMARDQYELGKWLLADGPSRPTMVSDILTYGAISLQQRGERFVFPFDRLYAVALRMPSRLPPQVVVPDPRRPGAAGDPITRWYPNLYEQGYGGYVRVYDRGGWRILRQSKGRN